MGTFPKVKYGDVPQGDTQAFDDSHETNWRR